MYLFIKEGIQRIKDTRKYARDKNVPNWYAHIFGAVVLVVQISLIATLYGILVISQTSLSQQVFGLVGSSMAFYPFIISFFFMIRYGQYPIKFLICLSAYIQKYFMKLINKLDMYLWKKTGKDSMASNFMVKHRRIVQLIMYSPLIIALFFQLYPS